MTHTTHTLPAPDAHRRATRFFWAWLILATCASVAGNVAHALLATAHSPGIAAAAAVVPPALVREARHVRVAQ